MDLALFGKVAFVTGGGSGFGEAIAHGLATEGCIVAVADRDYAAAERAAAACRLKGPRAFPLSVDVGNPQTVSDAVAKTVLDCGGVDILVNSAGILKTGDVIGSSLTDWEEVSRVNLSGVLHCIKAVAPEMMRRRWGRIINVASISAMRGSGVIGNTLYGTTKAGVVALTMGLARELGPSGVTVNAIAPGVADTPMTHTQLSAERRQTLLKRIPLGRFATPSDVANVAMFLASDRSSYVSGAVISVDGGLLTA